MSKPKIEYEVRMHHADASLTMVMMIQASSDNEARAQALKMLKGDVRNANIWRSGRLVDSISTMTDEAPRWAQESIKPDMAKRNSKRRRAPAPRTARKSLKRKK